MNLSEIWDGEVHYFQPGEDFPDDGARLIVAGWEDLDQEEALSPFESPSVAPVIRETGDVARDTRRPLAGTEQAWGSLSVKLTSFSRIIGAPKDQYQLINHRDNIVRWSFQTKDFYAERV